MIHSEDFILFFLIYQDISLVLVYNLFILAKAHLASNYNYFVFECQSYFELGVKS